MLNRQLMIFKTCVERGSFAKAAESLYLSAPAVMKQIDDLEKRLGLTLLIRTPRGVRPTAAGESFFTDIQYMMEYASAAKKRAAQAEKHADGTLIRIGATPLYQPHFLFQMIKENERAFAPFQIQVIHYDGASKNILPMFESLGADIDFIVASGDSKAWLKRCAVHSLGQYRLRIALSRRHRLAQKESLSLTDLEGEQMVVFKSGESPVLDRFRAELLEKVPGIQIRSTSYYDINTFNLCEQNNCLLLTLDCWEHIHPSLETKPVNWEYTLPFGLFYSPGVSGPAAEFLRVVQTLADNEKAQ